MTACVKEAQQASAALCPPAPAIWLPWAVAGVLLAAVVVAAFALGKFPTQRKLPLGETMCIPPILLRTILRVSMS